MTGGELYSMVREYIHEGVADFWTEPRLLSTMNSTLKRLVLKMQKAADAVFYTSCTIPTISGTQAYLLPNGTLYTTAPKCSGKVDMIHHVGETYPLQKGDWRLFHGGASGKPTHVVLIGKYLYFYPVPDAVYSLTLWYPYFPADIVNTGAEFEFLEGFEELIALETAKKSLIKDEADLSDIRVEIQTMWAEFIEVYAGSRITGAPDEVPSDIYDIE